MPAERQAGETTLPAPHPDPHPPRHFTPPPNACDAHCHVFGPAHRFPFAPGRRYTPPDAPLEQFQWLQERLSLTRAVFVQASCHGTDNRAMLDALERGRGRYAGVAMLDDDTTDAELTRMHELGVRGARLNFVRHLGGAPSETALWRLVERTQPLGWHLMLHFDAADLPRYRPLLDRLPVSFVIDHMARVDAAAGVDQRPFQELLDLACDERCWVKVSGAERITADGTQPYDDVVPFARALIATAPGRVLWGTDWPHPNVRHMPDDGDLLDLVVAFAPDAEDRQRLLADNPAALYDFA